MLRRHLLIEKSGFIPEDTLNRVHVCRGVLQRHDEWAGLHCVRRVGQHHHERHLRLTHQRAHLVVNFEVGVIDRKLHGRNFFIRLHRQIYLERIRQVIAVRATHSFGVVGKQDRFGQVIMFDAKQWHEYLIGVLC